MEFSREHTADDWSATAILNGRQIVVSADGSWDVTELSAAGDAAVARVAAATAEIEANIIDALHELFNDAWADPEQGFPTLRSDAFLSRFSLATIHLLDEPDALSLFFDESGLFGGHTVEIFWTPEKMHPATLAG